MLRSTAKFLLALLLPACTLMPPDSERIRARQMEDAVLPMAATALESGQLETARRLYRRLLDVDPESVPARMGLGDVSLRERETAAAARWYLAALIRAERPGQRHAALIAHGRAALAAGQLEAARESFSRLVEPGENAPRASLAWGHNGLGLALLLEGDLHGAVAAMEQAVLHAPEEQRFQANLNRAVAMLGDYPTPGEGSREHKELELPPGQVGDTDGPPQSRGAAPAVAEAERELSESSRPGSPGQDSPEREPEVGNHEIPARTAGRPLATEPANRHETALAVALHLDAVADTEPHAATDRTEGRPVSENDRDDHSSIGPEAIKETAGDDRRQSESVAEAKSAPVADSIELQPASAAGSEDRGMEVVADESAATAGPRPRVFVFTENGLTHLQFGAFAREFNADAAAGELRNRIDLPVEIVESHDAAGASLHRVRVGPLPTEDALFELLEDLEAQGYSILNRPSASAERDGRRAIAPRNIEALLVTEDGRQYLQAGAYRERFRAETVVVELRSLTDRPVRITEVARGDASPLHRVRIGPLEANDAVLDLFGLADRQ